MWSLDHYLRDVDAPVEDLSPKTGEARTDRIFAPLTKLGDGNIENVGDFFRSQ